MLIDYIAIGVNDANGTVGTFQSDYACLVSHAMSRGLQVICVPPLNEPNEVANPSVSRRFAFQPATVFACTGAGVPSANVFNPAAVGIVSNPNGPTTRRLFAPGQVHFSAPGHRLFADRPIGFMVARGFWRRR